MIATDADGTQRFEVQSQSKPDTRYHVSFNGKPTAFCDCPDWKKRDLALAAQGVPFSLFHCKHAIAARLAVATGKVVRPYDRYCDSYLFLEPCDFGNGRNPIHNAFDRKFPDGWKISGQFIIALRADGSENPLYYEAEPVIRRIFSDWRWDSRGITDEYKRGEISPTLFLFQDR